MRKSSGRPCGVGLVLVGSSEQLGCQIFQTCPSGEVHQMSCTAIGMSQPARHSNKTLMSELGGRSQSARTYLEKNIEALETASVDEVRLICALHYSVNDADGQIIMIALRALNEANVDASDLTSDKCEVAIVELNTYTLKSSAEVAVLLTNL